MHIKKRKQYSLSTQTITKIENLATSNSESYSSVIEKAVDHYYKNIADEDQELEKILTIILAELNRLRVIGNVINKDTNMMLEFWNHHFVVNDYKELITTDKYKTKELLRAEQLINERIVAKRNNRQRRKTSAIS